MIRKQWLSNNNIYHIFNKSIAHFKIFNSEYEYIRTIESLKYYQTDKPPVSYSRFQEYSENTRNQIIQSFATEDRLIEIICYCFMPTHYHLILKQLKNKGISIYLNNIQNSYTRYFNTVHKRKGPLWVGPFKNVLIIADEQLLHLTRYIHLNPSSSGLVPNPIGWEYSSYKEYLNQVEGKNKICDFDKLIDIDAKQYQKFTEEYIDGQKELAIIKDLIME